MFQYATSSGKEFGLAHGVSMSLISLGRCCNRSLVSCNGSRTYARDRSKLPVGFRQRYGRRPYGISPSDILEVMRSYKYVRNTI